MAWLTARAPRLSVRFRTTSANAILDAVEKGTDQMRAEMHAKRAS